MDKNAIVLTIFVLFVFALVAKAMSIESENSDLANASGEYKSLMAQCLDDRPKLSCLADLKIVADEAVYNQARKAMFSSSNETMEKD